MLPLPKLGDSKGGDCLRAASPLSGTALTELTVSAPFFAWHGQVPDASARAFDEARELFLSQMKIVSYYLHVRPIVKKVSNDEIVRFGYGKGSSDSLHFGDSRRRIFATGPLSSLLRLVTNGRSVKSR